MAEDRETLIAMGFTPDRVDWAIESTPDADLQTRLDHIFEHQQETVPVQVTTVPISITPVVSTITTRLYSPPSYPPSQTRIPSTPPAQVTPDIQGITESIGNISFKGSASTTSRATDAANSMETEAVQRYKSFLLGHSNTLRNLADNQEAAKLFYEQLTLFFEEEATSWRTLLHIPIETVSVSHVAEPKEAVPVSIPEPIQSSLEADVTPTTALSNAGQSAETTKEYDCIGVYDPSRPRIPILETVIDYLASVITGYAEDDFVEKARNRAWDIHPRMSEDVSTLRWKATAEANTTVFDDAFQRRSAAHYQRLNELPLMDWEMRNRLQQEYDEQEKLIRQRINRENYGKYCAAFLDPARETIHRAFTDIHPIYAEIKGYLEADIPELDVVRAVRALEQVSDTMELGMNELETLEDDRIERKWVLQREIVTDDRIRADPYGDANKMQREKDHRILEMKAIRATQKMNRRADFYNLVTRRVREAIAGVDRDYETLKGVLNQLLERIPETLPFQEEEAQAQSGDHSAMTIPLPSKEFDTQIRYAQSIISSINRMRDDMRDVLRSFERKQMVERRENDLAQLAVNESREGRADNWYLQAGRLLSENAQREDEEIETAYRQGQEQRKEEFDQFMIPVTEVLARYNDRERLVLHKLASGMTAHGPMVSGDGSADAMFAMQQIMMQQQMDNMKLNMMMVQHTANMNMISNFASAMAHSWASF